MSEIVLPDTVRAIEQNLNNYLLEFGNVREGQILHNDALKAIYTGTPLLNRIFDASFPGADSVNLNQILQPFKDWHVPVTWMTGPSTKPSGLGEWLLTQGFNHLSTWTGMALKIADLPEVDLPEGFSTLAVDHEEVLTQWTDIARPAFGLSDQVRNQFKHLFSQLLIGIDAPFEGFLALLNGQPVGTCFLYEQDSVVGVYWVATDPDARHQGIATMLTYAALTQKPAKSLAVLHATPPGRGVYAKMGFEPQCEFGLYGWNPAE